MGDVVQGPGWSPLQCLIKARDLAENGKAAIVVIQDDNGHWHSVTSSVGVGSLLTAAEVLKIRARDALQQV